MRSRRPFLVLLLAVTAVLLIFLLSRRATRADFGPAVALCPGPDLYGYTCTGGPGFAYIDATHDTQLYEDDGVIALELPFPFVFYGTSYDALYAGSNGVLQFGSANTRFINDCLIEQPAPGMGNMIAPFWDDLDLRFQGFLETEVVGEAPDRIFVVEWDDVPRFGDNPDDRVTFAVQLFEGSHDIIFLYEDVTTFEGHNGGSATIGLQSEEQGVALQFSCNQAAVADAGRIYFPHPAVPNLAIEPKETAASSLALELTAKGQAADLIASLNQRGPTILTQLQAQWRSQTPSRAATWEWVDMTGNGRSELIMLQYGGPKQPELTQLIVLAADESGQMMVLYDEALSTRAEPVAAISIVETADLTHDNQPDLLLQDDNRRIWVVTAVNNAIIRLPIPERCRGSLGILDANHDGQLDIVRDGCQTAGRVIFSWDESETAFQPVANSDN